VGVSLQVDDIMYVASKLGLYAALTVAQHGLLSARDKVGSGQPQSHAETCTSCCNQMLASL
jgi:hypothetical protein